MQISKINYCVVGNSNQKSKTNNHFASNSLNLKQNPSNISFGFDPKTLMDIINAASFVMKVHEIKSALKEATKGIKNGYVSEGLDFGADIIKDYGKGILKDISGKYYKFIETASEYGARLSDHSYENRDAKKKFIEAMFFHTDGSTVPSEATEFFRHLDNGVYRDFKKHLIEKTLFKHQRMIYNLDNLLEGVADKDFIKRMVKKERELAKAAEDKSDRGRDFLDILDDPFYRL